jgi:uncharacterized protein (DUF1778 family)
MGRKAERLECRATLEQKRRVERAAELSEQTVSEFTIQAACERADAVLRDHDILRLTQREARAFYEALQESKPTDAARRAASDYLKDIRTGRIRSQ